MSKANKNYVLVLSSGGLDSTACIRFYKKLKFEVEALFIDYGQSASSLELKSIKKISNHYKIKLNKVQVKNYNKFKDGVIPGRNAFLLFSALMNFKRPNGTIACGIHSGTNYFDCSKEFIEQIQELFEQYSQGTIKIGTPFLTFNKQEIFNYCISEKIPVELTYSCEVGNKKPCGKCATCKDLIAIYASKK